MAQKARKPAPAAAPMIDIGINARDRERIADSLAHVLADTYTLYLRTHSYHWNVEGPMFNTLHLMFMGQYTELWNAFKILTKNASAAEKKALYSGTAARVYSSRGNSWASSQACANGAISFSAKRRTWARRVACSSVSNR